MGKKFLKTVLFIVAAFVIMFFTGEGINTEAATTTSDFLIEDGVLIDYQGTAKEVVIPKTVTTIGVGAFKNCTFQKVTIPESVVYIESEAFLNCKMLIEIVIPNSVWELGQSSFQGCTSLSRVELSNLGNVGISAFQDCISLKEVIIPDGVRSINHFAFKNCSSLTMIDLPESINFIGDGCFTNCTSLETILFPTQDLFIGEKAFYNTLWLKNYVGDYVIINHTLIQYRGKDKKITIPSDVNVISHAAFIDCSFITNVNIPMGVKEIGNSAFAGCTSLKVIAIPDSVTRIGFYAFKGCSMLASITVPNNVNIGLGCFEETKFMEEYNGEFIILGGNLLKYQGKKSKVVIPDNVTVICTGAFDENSIVNEVVVPKSVGNIYYAAFRLCNYLQKIYINGESTMLDYQAFLACNEELKLYGLTGGTVEEYANQHYIQFISNGLTKTKVTLYLGGDISASLGVEGMEDNVIWKSKNTSIARVNKFGKVTAVNVGTTEILATFDGVTATCEITVKDMFISKDTLTIKIGQTSRLNLVGASTGITWISSNKIVATVNSKGIVNAKKAGTTTITALINGRKYTCKVTVKY